MPRRSGLVVPTRSPTGPLGALPRPASRPAREGDRPRPARTTLALCVLTAVTVMTVDAAAGESSPVEPLRAGAGEVFGPLETGAALATSPVVRAVDFVTEMRGLRAENAELERRNDELTAELVTSEVDRNRLAEYDRLSDVAAASGFDLVPARVVAVGPAQAFARTVTIDVGTVDGVRADRTVVAAAGLVGRVLSAGRHTATVLLAVDAGSVIGGRLARSMELGLLRGNGSLGSDGVLTLDLVAADAVPVAGDSVVTWGSRGGAPYVAGVPVGDVVDVQASAGDQSVTASVRPFVDMSALDVVGVVVVDAGDDRSDAPAASGRLGPAEGDLP